MSASSANAEATSARHPPTRGQPARHPASPAAAVDIALEPGRARGYIAEVAFVLTRGISFHTHEMGELRAPPLLMLHGLFLGNVASWYFTAAPALARTRRVLLYDLRGHGKTTRTPDGYDLETMAGDLEAIAAGFDERPLDLCGHSYGALVALRFTLDHPERVRRLVLVEAPLPPSRFSELQAIRDRSAGDLVQALPDDLKLVVAEGGRRAARLVEGLRKLADETSILADLAVEPDIPDAHLARIERPVLCVYGDRSACLPVGARIARAIPGARLEVLPGSHYLHLDAGPALARAIAEHLDG